MTMANCIRISGVIPGPDLADFAWLDPNALAAEMGLPAESSGSAPASALHPEAAETLASQMCHDLTQRKHSLRATE